jgi:hypothetical protein
VTDPERIAHLERELAEERAERRRLSDTLRVMVEAQAKRESVEAERKATRSARNARFRSKSSSETSHETHTETSQSPSPLLAGSPPLPAPISPPPISSPHPFFSSSASASGGALPNATEHAVEVLVRQAPLLPEAVAEKPKRPRKPQEKPTDPRHAPLVQALVDAHAEVKGPPYAFRGGRDAKAVSECLALADQDPKTAGGAAPAEVVRRWLNAMTWRGFPACTGLDALAEHWNTYAKPQVAPDNDRSRPRLGPNPVTNTPAVLTGDRPRL